MLKGVVTALITPFTDGGGLCRSCLEQLVELQLRGGVESLFISGTYGEGVITSTRTREELLKVAIEVAPGRLSILPHVGGADVESVLHLAKLARDLGYRAVSVVGPVYHVPTRLGLVKYFSYVARAGVDIVVYNNKGRQGYNISPDDFEYVAREVPSVVGIKDTSYDVDQLLEYVKRFGSRYLVAGAGDNLLYYTFAIGAPAHICGISNLFPELVVELYRAVSEGNHAKAVEIQYRINGLRKLFRKFGVETQEVLRVALRFRGVDPGYPPLQMSFELSEQQLAELRRIVEEYLGA